MLGDGAGSSDFMASAGLVQPQLAAASAAGGLQHASWQQHAQRLGDEDVSIPEALLQAQGLQFAPSGPAGSGLGPAAGLGSRYPSQGSADVSGLQQGMPLPGDAQMRDLLTLVEKLGLSQGAASSSRISASSGRGTSQPNSNQMAANLVAGQLLPSPSPLPNPLQQQLHNMQLNQMADISQQQLNQQQQLTQQQLTQQLEVQLGHADAEAVMALVSTLGMGTTGSLFSAPQSTGLGGGSQSLGAGLGASSGLGSGGLSGSGRSGGALHSGGALVSALASNGLNGLSGNGLNGLSGSGLNGLSGSGLDNSGPLGAGLGGSSLTGFQQVQQSDRGLTNGQLLDAMQSQPSLLINMLAAQNSAGNAHIGAQNQWQSLMGQHQLNCNGLGVAGAAGMSNTSVSQHLPMLNMQPNTSTALQRHLLRNAQMQAGQMQPQSMNLHSMNINNMAAAYLASRPQPLSAPQASRAQAPPVTLGTVPGLATNYGALNMQLGGSMQQQVVHTGLPLSGGALQPGPQANQQELLWAQHATVNDFFDARPQQTQQLQGGGILSSAAARLAPLIAANASSSGHLRAAASSLPVVNPPAAGSEANSAPASSSSAAVGALAPTTPTEPPPKPRSQHKLYKTELCRNWLLGRNCRYGAKCQFAHGQWELQPKPEFRDPPPAPGEANPDVRDDAALEGGSESGMPLDSPTGMDRAASSAGPGSQSAPTTTESNLMSALMATVGGTDVLTSSRVEQGVVEAGVGEATGVLRHQPQQQAQAPAALDANAVAAQLIESVAAGVASGKEAAAE